MKLIIVLAALILFLALPVAASAYQLGDLNHDGCVNQADLDILTSVYGQFGDFEADLNGDGVVEASDYSLLLSLLTDCQVWSGYYSHRWDSDKRDSENNPEKLFQFSTHWNGAEYAPDQPGECYEVIWAQFQFEFHYSSQLKPFQIQCGANLEMPGLENLGFANAPLALVKPIEYLKWGNGQYSLLTIVS